MSKTKRKAAKLSPIYLILAVILAFSYWYFFGNGRQSTPVSSDGSLIIHYIDVGQGDSSLLIAPGGEAILIDAGPGSAEDSLDAYLESQNVKSIKYAVFTHPHEDHIGGADCVINNYNVENVIMPDVESDSATFDKMLDAIENKDVNIILSSVGDTYSFGDAIFTILGPCGNGYESLNNYSVALRVDYGKNSFLFTGDAEELSEKEMLEKNRSDAFYCDILQIGHHGSSTSTCNVFLDAASPSIAVISCGKDNSYGHPHSETLKKLSKRDITVYRTDTDGTVVFASDGTEITKVR